MNYTYCSLPVEIQAFQMTQERRWDNKDWPNWLHKAWNEDATKAGALFINPADPAKERLQIMTLEGVHDVTWNDYIIQGLLGELYPCKPEVFQRKYVAKT